MATWRRTGRSIACCRRSGQLVADANVKRVVLCSGKVYYDLLEEREKRGIKDVALIRVEQLYPFPKRTMEKELQRYANAEVVWCQEEPKNMGAWSFIEHRIEDALTAVKVAAKRPRYVGRPEAASPATRPLQAAQSRADRSWSTRR